MEGWVYKRSPDHAVDDGINEDAHVEEQVKLSRNVQTRKARAALIIHVLIKDAHREHGHRSKAQIVHGDQCRIVNGLEKNFFSRIWDQMSCQTQ